MGEVNERRCGTLTIVNLSNCLALILVPVGSMNKGHLATCLGIKAAAHPSPIHPVFCRSSGSSVRGEVFLAPSIERKQPDTFF